MHLASSNVETLTIDNFGGLQHAKVGTSAITVLIGQQAVGKSVVAKLFFFFRGIAEGLVGAAVQDKDIRAYQNEVSERFLRYFPSSIWEGSKFEIVYQTRDNRIRISTGDAKGDLSTLDLELSPFFEEALTEMGARRRSILGTEVSDKGSQADEQLEGWRREFEQLLADKLGPYCKFEQIFIPAGRAFFAQVKASVFSTLQAGGSLDPFLVAFGAVLERSKDVLESRGFFDESNGDKPQVDRKRFEVVHEELSRILRAKLVRRDKQEFLIFADGRTIPLPQASSGQQEVLPLLFLLARFLTLSHLSGRAVYMEEPEAHLFPTTQRDVIELMAHTFRSRSDEMCLIVTTHSPYILTALNNLLQAGIRFSKASVETKQKLEKIIPESVVLYPGEVGAYVLEDGSARPIMDSKTQLIDGSLIDRVSDQLAVQFDKLLWEE